MPTKKQLHTRNLIIQTMYGLLQHKPFSAITTADICSAAAIHHTTFYRYFTDKYALLGATLTDTCAPIITLMTQGMTFLDALLQLIDQNRTVMLNITAHNQRNDVYYDLVQIFAQQLTLAATTEITMTDPLLVKLQAADNLDYAAHAVAGMIVGVLIGWADGSRSAEPNDLQTLFSERFLQLL
ncbi:TetR/AcrR family transcriptional regulator [Furfurilactobacillus siliginis]|nr:TetR/AcrR family transcriptional regulator [Furfurilactobacillus siliginis]GEK28206.1 TetR family transcriptional regulator [Furfurilactobacillus siliginis]